MKEIENILIEVIEKLRKKQSTVSNSTCKWSAFQEAIDEVELSLNKIKSLNKGQ